MKKNIAIIAVLLVSLFAMSCKKEVLPPAPVGPLPTDDQLRWHEWEQYAFVHFTVNTFTDKEWGYGDESPQVFNPTDFDAEQWAKTLQEVGFKGLILTCKHHDGFCLWPASYTEHSVKNSPFRDGKGDVVREVANACKKYGLFFGVYLSPWDRYYPEYGKDGYAWYYSYQLSELLSKYGDIAEVWFDGANGGDGYYGGARETRRIYSKTYYPWASLIEQIRQMSPRTLIFSDAGPDVRWCGNEAGYVGLPNWNTISIDTLFPGQSHIFDLLNHGSEDGKSWCPAEVNVSIRPGWFYHASEDHLVKQPAALFRIYLESVGRGSNWLLNIPPDRRGLFHENDIQALKGWKKMKDELFAHNLAHDNNNKVNITATQTRGNAKIFAPENLLDNDKETYWTTDDSVTAASITLDLQQLQTVRYILLQEYIKLGQRVETFTIEAWQNNQWIPVASETTIGYKRIVVLNPITTSKIRINITAAKACPILANLEVY
ncbi:MAG: alpha-L-fucosidase [Bacteroidales bacterium]|jgi:alpha-L-fucosidase|nr:alpha-L-fucosidase [Bacteroidales bacterium]